MSAQVHKYKGEDVKKITLTAYVLYACPFTKNKALCAENGLFRLKTMATCEL